MGAPESVAAMLGSRAEVAATQVESVAERDSDWSKAERLSCLKEVKMKKEKEKLPAQSAWTKGKEMNVEFDGRESRWGGIMQGVKQS